MDTLDLIVDALSDETVLRWVYGDADLTLERQEGEALDAGCDTAEVGLALSRSRAAMTRKARGDILSELRAASNRLA